MRYVEKKEREREVNRSYRAKYFIVPFEAEHQQIDETHNKNDYIYRILNLRLFLFAAIYCLSLAILDIL